MTQRASSNNPKRSPLVTLRYMFGTAKRGWALIVLFFIAFLLIYTVQAMMSLSSLRSAFDYLAGTYTREEMVERVGNRTTMLWTTFTVLSSISAIFAGCYFMSFMHNKVSAGFYHSLPERRSGHFISAVFGAVVTYLTAAVSNFVLVFLVYAANGFLYKEIVPMLFIMLGCGVFYFLVFLSITVLAGAVSGNSVIQAMMTGFFIFFLPAVYFSSMLLLSYGSDIGAVRYLNVDRLLTDPDAYKWLSPLFREAFVLSGEGYVSLPGYAMIIIDVIVLAAAFALAYYAYSKRPIERSGSSIIFGWLGETVKYIIIAPCAVCLSYIFGALSYGNDLIWNILGFIAGLVISYMLCNTIINRSAKAMFTHVKGMLIYSAVLVVFTCVLVSGLFGVPDRMVPNTDELTVYLSGQVVTFTDKDEIATVRDAMKEFVSELRDNRSSDIDYRYEFTNKYESQYADTMPDYIAQFDQYADSMSRKLYLSVKYKNLLGMTLSYDYGSADYAYANKVIEALLSCDSYMKQLSPANPLELNYIGMGFAMSTSHVINNKNAEIFEYADIDALRGRFIMTNMNVGLYDYSTESKNAVDTVMTDIFTPHTLDYFQRHAIGWVDISRITPSGHYAGDISQTLYFDDLKEFAGRAKFLFDKISLDNFTDDFNIWMNTGSVSLTSLLSMSYDEYLDGIAESIDEISVYDRKTGTSKVYTGKDVREIIPHLAAISSSSISPLTRTDGDHVVLVKARDYSYRYMMSDYDYYDKYNGVDYGYEEGSAYYDTDEQWYKVTDCNTYYVTWFLEGDVPEFLK